MGSLEGEMGHGQSRRRDGSWAVWKERWVMGSLEGEMGHGQSRRRDRAWAV